MEDYVYGRNSVLELLKNNKRTVKKIIILKTAHGNAKISEITEIAKSRKIIFQFVPKDAFLKYSDVSHQGVVAFVSPVNYASFEDFLKSEKKYKKVVITDGVEDPHNFGSIIRTAVCAGFDAVIFPSRRNASVNATVEKASAGAVNRIDLIAVNSLTAAVNKLKDNDFWIIATDINSDDNYYEIDYCDMNFAIILGSEEEGISSTLSKQSDFRVKIPMANGFDSLNVANAASIIMYESVKQIIQKSGKVV